MLGMLFAAGALVAAAPAAAQRDRYDYEERYLDEERYEYEDDDRYDDERRYREERRFDYARVIEVEPIVDIQSRPVKREECRQEPVARRETVRRDAPAITPGIVGAVLGQPSATGSNRTVAVAGASTPPPSRPAYTKRCTYHTDYVDEERITGYDVTYRYRGRTYYAVTERDPGERIRIEVTRR